MPIAGPFLNSTASSWSALRTAGSAYDFNCSSGLDRQIGCHTAMPRKVWVLRIWK